MTTTTSDSVALSQARRTLVHPVVAAGILLVVAQVGVRAWASFGSWFLGDDYNLMSRLYQAPLTMTELFTPHDSQLMPGGIFFAWVMSNVGPHNWTVGAAILVCWQAAASLACLLMLVTVFGRRWAILPLLLVYLASPLTLTSYMWWASAINQVPLQTAFFLTVAAAVRYFRTRRPVWLALTLAAVLLGLLFYVKAVLFLPVVIGLAFLFFGPEHRSSTPGPQERLRLVVRSARGTLRLFAPLWTALVAMGVGYAALYISKVSNPLEGYDLAWAALADNFFRISLGPSLIGGPWRWWNPIAPQGLVDPPSWAVTATWIVAALATYRLWLLGTARWRALLILAGYLLAIFVLLGTGRAVIIGDVSALELRYLADATPVAVLCLGLLLLEVRTPHDSPMSLTTSQLTAPRVLVSVLVGAVLIAGAGLSTVRYVALWHDDYDAKVYTRNVAAGARLHDLRVVEAWVPIDVVSPLRFPDNYVSRVFRQFSNIRALTAGNDLAILDQTGIAKPADVAGSRSSLRGSVARCGYKVTTREKTIGLRPRATEEPLESTWWVAVDYIATGDAIARVELGDLSGDYQVLQGLHRLLVRGEGSVSDATLAVKGAGVTLCVDQVRVGKVHEWQPTS